MLCKPQTRCRFISLFLYYVNRGGLSYGIKFITLNFVIKKQTFLYYVNQTRCLFLCCYVNLDFLNP